MVRAVASRSGDHGLETCYKHDVTIHWPKAAFNRINQRPSWLGYDLYGQTPGYPWPIILCIKSVDALVCLCVCHAIVPVRVYTLYACWVPKIRKRGPEGPTAGITLILYRPYAYVRDDIFRQEATCNLQVLQEA